MRKVHDSMRGWFFGALYDEMQKDDRIWALTGDLGFGAFDAIRDDFPKRFVNFGASECLMLGAAVGLTYEGKIPFCYSITPFLIYRPFEWLRNYVNHERLPVKLIGAGIDDDYKHDGLTHHCFELEKVLDCLPNISRFFPKTKQQAALWVHQLVEDDGPCFMGLRR